MDVLATSTCYLAWSAVTQRYSLCKKKILCFLALGFYNQMS